MAGVGGGRADRVQEPWVWDFRAESLRGSATSWCLRPGVPKLQSLSLLKEPMRTQGIFLKKRIFGNPYAQGIPPMVLTQDAFVPFAGWSSPRQPEAEHPTDSATQRTQYPLIQEYTLSHNIKVSMIYGISRN